MRRLQLAVAVLLLGLLPTLPLLAAERSAPPYSAAELDQLLAPVALYPDGVLSQLLIATTFPLDIVQADRWARRRPGLAGDAAVDAAAGEGWHPSVTSLVAFPDLLARLSEDLNWTQALGEAFLAQPLEIADRIQTLRRQADAAGSLQSLQTVAVRRDSTLIFIEPAAPEIVYVPVYNTRIVYGDWAWPRHPPVHWSSPGLRHSGPAFYWGPGVRYRPQHYYSSFYWPQREVVIVHRPGRGAYRPLWERARDHRHQRWQADDPHRGAWTPVSRRPPFTAISPGTDRRPGVHRPPPQAPATRAPRDSGSRWSTAARPTSQAGVHQGSAWRGGRSEPTAPAPAFSQTRPVVSGRPPPPATGATRWTRSENRAPVPAVRQAPPQRQLAPPVSPPRGPQGPKELPH